MLFSALIRANRSDLIFCVCSRAFQNAFGLAGVGLRTRIVEDRKPASATVNQDKEGLDADKTLKLKIRVV